MAVDVAEGLTKACTAGHNRVRGWAVRGEGEGFGKEAL
jgi:hypothetical protein